MRALIGAIASGLLLFGLSGCGNQQLSVPVKESGYDFPLDAFYPLKDQELAMQRRKACWPRAACSASGTTTSRPSRSPGTSGTRANGRSDSSTRPRPPATATPAQPFRTSRRVPSRSCPRPSTPPSPGSTSAAASPSPRRARRPRTAARAKPVGSSPREPRGWARTRSTSSPTTRTTRPRPISESRASSASGQRA